MTRAASELLNCAYSGTENASSKWAGTATTLDHFHRRLESSCIYARPLCPLGRMCALSPLLPPPPLSQRLADDFLIDAKLGRPSLSAAAATTSTIGTNHITSLWPRHLPPQECSGAHFPRGIPLPHSHLQGAGKLERENDLSNCRQGGRRCVASCSQIKQLASWRL